MDNKIVFGILSIALNGYGVPCFLQGRIKTGVWRIVLNFLTLGVVGTINSIMGIIMGVKVLKMTDEEFEACKATIDSGFPAYKEEA